MPVFFLVRARIADGVVKGDFDRWYGDEHMPDALRTFKAKRAWRAWSDVDPSVHYAFYEFDSMAAARSIEGSDGLRRLVADFDGTWGDRVVRSRDFIQTAEKSEG